VQKHEELLSDECFQTVSISQAKSLKKKALNVFEC
jgi:hypothetical protein